MIKIIIGTTPTIIYKFKVVSPSDFRDCILTIKSNGQIILEKALTDATIGEDSVSTEDTIMQYRADPSLYVTRKIEEAVSAPL